MQQSAERFGAVTELAEVYKVSLSGKIKTLETSEGVFQGRTVVIATGASPRPLGVPGEDTLIGKGVHYCAACDGAPYRGKTVAVVGGGNVAMDCARTSVRAGADEVSVVYRRRKDDMTALPAEVESAIAEGVETREQYEYLKARGCDVIQGYYFGRPMTAESFGMLLSSQTAGR